MGQVRAAIPWPIDSTDGFDLLHAERAAESGGIQSRRTDLLIGWETFTAAEGAKANAAMGPA